MKGREMISKYQVTKLERTGPMGSVISLVWMKQDLSDGLLFLDPLYWITLCFGFGLGVTTSESYYQNKSWTWNMNGIE